MQPTFADFSSDPALLANGEAEYRGCVFGGSHLKLEAGGSVGFVFAVEEGEEILEATLKVTALVSKMGPSPGYAPLSILVNGEPLVAQMTIPGGGDLPQTCVFAVPGRWLRPGRNQVQVRSGVDARTMLWLYRITVDSVYERDRSERALAAASARRSVFAFTTERQAHGSASGAPGWTPAGRLLVHIDRGEEALPAQVSWRAADGAEAAISFQSAMTDFHGYRRDPDGGLAEFRGRLADRWEYPDGVQGAPLHRFRTQEGWGGRWHTSGELRLLVADGGAPVERITWRDQRENSGSVAFEPGAAGFLGYYQRVNEGPIGYRGTAAH
ncbi:hypothetical protein [Actinomadura rifamycini]|uniref:hypothetical protein n=1 Tax=Actinomadura rifamycini TaxID=31962 RepID=UPI0003FEC31B|nr:hypothetical protein [Actinomadura rifamycini]